MDALYAGQHGDRTVSYCRAALLCCCAVLALCELGGASQFPHVAAKSVEASSGFQTSSGRGRLGYVAFTHATRVRVPVWEFCFSAPAAATHRMDALYAGQHGDRTVSYCRAAVLLCCCAVLALCELGGASQFPHVAAKSVEASSGFQTSSGRG
uniref:Uncharacterized protein n=1 Tax=Phytophthora ramorum TaxID=164328 RepID=H3H768_PHYRM